MDQRPWWKKPLRVIQTNLQVKDTPAMNPAKIAQDIEEMGANVLVMNVGGIYAWYPSRVPWHNVNPYLPKDHDLLAELIDACHARNIRLVARYDFSKVSDWVYQRRPQWFSRGCDGKGQVIGAMRQGEWDLLYSTCINGGYRNEVAAEILRESLSQYDIDGVFFNAPHATNCHCEICQQKYQALYGVPLPDDEKEWDSGWRSRCLYDNMKILRAAVREVRPEVPTILYYAIASDNLYERLETCDMICAEPQDVLSLGWKAIPQSFKPALCIRLGCSEPEVPRPFGIIHSCPGMDWRHTGLPPAEYMYWMSQVPANGGQIWHSITGFPDTITDRRIIDSVSAINHQIMRVEQAMDGARSRAKVAMLWDMNGGNMAQAFGGLMESPQNGWAEAMLGSQIPFDMILPEQVEKGRLKQYKVLVAPGGLQGKGVRRAVADFVREGGCALVECWQSQDEEMAGLMGVERQMQTSEYLQASYLRFERDGEVIRQGFERTPLLPHRGRTVYTTPEEGTRVLCTLVPPFAPMEAVGAPPERASLPCPQTDIPLVMEHAYGAGRVMTITFALSAAISELKLQEHTMLAANLLKLGLGSALDVHTDCLRGIQLMDYENGADRLIHLVNGIGQRPLSQNIPIRVQIRLDWHDEALPQVEGLLVGAPEVERRDDCVTITTKPVTTWEVLRIRSAKKE